MDKIAIVGLSCLFPDAETPAKYWQNLLDQKDSRTTATAEQMGVDADIFYADNKGTLDKYYCLKGGYIRDFHFDPQGYRLPAEYVDSMDDLFKWSLYVAREALRDSGHLTQPDVLQKCGVVLGNLLFPTQASHHLFAPIYKHALETAVQEILPVPLDVPPLAPHGEIAADNLKIAGYPAGFVSQALGLGGVHFAIDAACASSLYAVKLASQYLLSGKADLMLAGAVSRADPFFINMGFSIFHAYPENGAGSAPLDSHSDGLFAGEGAGMFVLKRHSDAVRDGDRIYAVIRGIGLSNDGKGKFLLQPNPKGQVLAFERAYKDAAVDPATIDYIECHATGTPVGDKTELNSMEHFFSKYGQAPLIGSAKSNFGHLLTAAGMVGMTKVILGMAHDQLPATINVNDPVVSRQEMFGRHNIVLETQNWPKQGHVERAAVSAFGFGGTNAHMVIEKESPLTPQPVQPKPVRMAITGMDAFFGSYDGLDAFGRALYEGRQSFGPVPHGRWQGIEENAELLKTYGFTDGHAPEGAFITDFDMDFFHFKIPPNNDQPIPQHLLILKVADRALQDAGIKEGENVAVIIATGAELALHRFRGRVDLTWQLKESLAQSGLELTAEQEAELERITKNSIHEPAQVNQYTSFIGNIMASRISAQWDFSGPSFTLSAEENSAFKALEVAQMFLSAGEVDAVVVGAVDLAGNVENVFLRNQIAPVSDGPATMSLDEKSNGWLIGEGAGAVVLRRHDDALAEQERVYATIDGVSVVQAHTNEGYALPTAAGLRKAIDQVWQNQALTPKDVGYLELFGSGIAAEDAAEVEGVTASYGNIATQPQCALGSVKATVGHTFAAAGIASLIKTAHALYYRYIPAVPNWDAPKQPERWQNGPFYVPTESRPWFTSPERPRRVAAINGLGEDGAYAHLILSDEPTQTSRPADYLPKAGLHLFPIAAADQQELFAQLRHLQQELAEGIALEKVARAAFETFEQNRSAPYKLVILGSSATEIEREVQRAEKGIPKAMQSGSDWKTPLGSYFAPRPLGREGKVAFVYPGAFSAYPYLGQQLFTLFPQLFESFGQHVPDVGELVGEDKLFPRTMQRLSKQELQAHTDELVDDAITMLRSGATYSTLVTQVLEEQFKLRPQAALGYSLGEMTMMYATGVWSAANNNSAALQQSPLFSERLSGAQNAVREFWGLPPVDGQTFRPSNSPLWKTALLKAKPAAVQAALPERVYLTHINTPTEVIIGGDPQQVDALIAQLGCPVVEIPYSHVIHCEPMRSEREEFVRLNRLPITERPDLDFYFVASEETQGLTSDSVAQSIATAATQTLDFPALIQRAYADGARIFVELGPRGACKLWIKTILREQDHLAVGIDRQKNDDQTMLVKMLAQLVAHDVALDLSPLYIAAEAQTQKQPRKLVRTVSLTEAHIGETIITAENKARFADVQVKERALAQATAVAAPRPIAVIERPVIHLLEEPPEILQEDETEQVMSIENLVEDETISDTVASSGANATAAVNSSSIDDGVIATHLDKLQANMARMTEVHEAFLRMRETAVVEMGKLIQLQAGLQNGAAPAVVQVHRNNGLPTAEVPQEISRVMPPQDPNRPNNYTIPDEVIWGPEDLLGYAEGSIVPMFGEEYAIIDSYARRVRLPMPPYLLVDRITKLDATPHVYEPSTMTTEYDIPFDAWYSTDGQIPWAVSVESGQCDLLLISYMGIDFQNKGERVYRLLDCTLTFLDDMPLEGHTLRYDISINSFAKSGESVLFFFSYNCYVGDKMVLKMRGGCAGFFSGEELAAGKGIITSERELEARRNMEKQYFAPLLSCNQTSFTRDELLPLSQGDLATVFGSAYAPNGRNPSLRMPPEAVLMVDGIQTVDPQGGPWGLGLIVSEKILEPDHWYFPCHFKDDEVMAGSLVAEGCSQLLQFYLLYLGMQTLTVDARFQPIPNQGQVVRTRKQITACSSKLIYRMEITELGTEPYPYAKANVDIIYEGIVVVDFKNLGLMLKEKAPDDPYAVPELQALIERTPSKPEPRTNGFQQSPALYDDYHIENFALGSISAAFGPDYAVFEGRRIPRTPNGDLKLFNRVVEINAERLKFDGRPNLVTEYDVPVDAWFYEKNHYPATMPYSVLMEVALQPCGFLSAYVGSTLPHAHEDFYFRNLDGDGHLIKDVDLRGRTIRNKVTLISSTALPGIIIQKFTYELSCEGEAFYVGTAVFGYFQPQSLQNQVGLDSGSEKPTWLMESGALGERLDLRSNAWAAAKASAPYYEMAGGQLNFLDEVVVVPDGGRYGQGYVYAVRDINPADWFFKAHFYQDPVMPGSLGVEAILEAMQAFAIHQGLGAELSKPHFTHADDHKVVWMYRGQIIPQDAQMYLEVDITHIEQTDKEVLIVGEASLWKTGMRIYHVKDIALRVVGE